MDDLVDASPLVRVLRLAADHAEALQDVDDVVDSAPFDTEFLRALIQQQEIFLLLAVNAQETPAELAQALLLAIVLSLALVVQLGVIQRDH